MFQLLVQSFIRGEVTVGIVLTLLLVSGRSDAQTLAFSLGGIGVFVLLQGLIPLSSRAPRQRSIKESSAARTSNSSKADSPESTANQAPPFVETTTSPCACARRPFNRREYFLRAFCSSLVVLATACLIYWLAPAAV